MTAGPGSLLVRADGGPAIGIGHISRCLALAQSWQDNGGDVLLVCREIPQILARRIEREGVECLVLPSPEGCLPEASRVADIAVGRNAVVVLDGYGFDCTYQEHLHHKVRTLMVVDDHGEIGKHRADVVLDQNLGAAEEVYVRTPPGCRLLLGPRFTLLRREFRQHPRSNREIPPVARRVLVSFGGSDRGRVTSRVLRALESLGGQEFDVRVAVAAGDPNLPELEELAGTLHWARLEHSVENMAELMNWAEIAITAGGSICWELAFMGVPSLLVTIAGNQEPIALRLSHHGAAISLGRSEKVDGETIARAVKKIANDRDLRRDMTRKGRQLIDGRGADRVVQALLR